ncbi:MAG: hypothetical protein H6862_07900 [Rhodospirillales bacterium]|nr:hypothetical protein [Rhodospirillales bacterium]
MIHRVLLHVAAVSVRLSKSVGFFLLPLGQLAPLPFCPRFKFLLPLHPFPLDLPGRLFRERF